MNQLSGAFRSAFASLQRITKSKTRQLQSQSSLVAAALQHSVLPNALQGEWQQQAEVSNLNEIRLNKYKQVLKETPIHERNLIEHNVGSTIIPVGVTQPLLVHDIKSQTSKEIILPMATSEATLVASTRRGVKALNASGGISVYTREEAHVMFSIAIDAQNLASMAMLDQTFMRELSVASLQEVVSKTSRYCQLRKLEILPLGNTIRLLLWYSTGDAAGQNMMTKASAAIMDYLDDHYGQHIKRMTRSYLDGDKKPTQFVATRPGSRGVEVHAQALIKKEVIKNVLRTTPQKVLALHNVSKAEAAAMGMSGNTVNATNVLTALFIALGQDVACVVECCGGIVGTYDLTPEGNLLSTFTFPNLVVGYVGGFTKTEICGTAVDLIQAESKCDIAKAMAAAVVAQDISCLAAVSGYKSKDFTTAHSSMGIRGYQVFTGR